LQSVESEGKKNECERVQRRNSKKKDIATCAAPEAKMKATMAIASRKIGKKPKTPL
jgi:hypothetical protein